MLLNSNKIIFSVNVWTYSSGYRSISVYSFHLRLLDSKDISISILKQKNCCGMKSFVSAPLVCSAFLLSYIQQLLPACVGLYILYPNPFEKTIIAGKNTDTYFKSHVFGQKQYMVVIIHHLAD